MVRKDAACLADHFAADGEQPRDDSSYAKECGVAKSCYRLSGHGYSIECHVRNVLDAVHEA